MELFEKVKVKVGAVVGSAKAKANGLKAKHKADGLLDELGRISYRQRTGAGLEADEQDAARLVTEIQALQPESPEPPEVDTEASA